MAKAGAAQDGQQKSEEQKGTPLGIAQEPHALAGGTPAPCHHPAGQGVGHGTLRTRPCSGLHRYLSALSPYISKYPELVATMASMSPLLERHERRSRPVRPHHCSWQCQTKLLWKLGHLCLGDAADPRRFEASHLVLPFLPGRLRTCVDPSGRRCSAPTVSPRVPGASLPALAPHAAIASACRYFPSWKS